MTDKATEILLNAINMDVKPEVTANQGIPRHLMTNMAEKPGATGKILTVP